MFLLGFLVEFFVIFVFCCFGRVFCYKLLDVFFGFWLLDLVFGCVFRCFVDFHYFVYVRMNLCFMFCETVWMIPFFFCFLIACCGFA